MGRHMNTVEQTEIWDRYEAGQTFTESGVGRAAVEYGAGLFGPSQVPAACGAAGVVFGADVADGPRRNISGAGSRRVVTVDSGAA